MMKPTLQILLSLTLLTQAAFAQTLDEVKSEMAEINESLNVLAKERTTGRTIVTAGGQQVMVLSAAAATYILGKSKLNLSTQRASAAALGLSSLLEKVVIMNDQSVLSKVLIQKRLQLIRLMELQEELKTRNIAENKELNAQIKDLKVKIDVLIEGQKQPAVVTTSYGLYAAAAASVASSGMIAHSLTKNPKLILATVLSALSLESAFVYNVEKSAVDQTISDLQARRNILQRQLGQ